MKLIKHLFIVILFAVLPLSSAHAAKKESCVISSQVRAMIKAASNNEVATIIKLNANLTNSKNRKTNLKAIYQLVNKENGVVELSAIYEKFINAGISKKKSSAPELLKGAMAHFKKSPFKSNSSLRQEYLAAIKTYVGKVSTANSSGNDALPDKADKYFNALYAYTAKYSDVPGFKLPAYKKLNDQDGFYLTMRYLNHFKVDSSSIESLDLRFENECPGNRCRFDAKQKNNQYIEFKSYKPNSEIKQLKQFISYLEKTSSVSQLKYVFNKEKTTQAEANMIMAKFVQRNKAGVWDKMSAEDKAELGVEDYEDFTSEKTKQFVSMFVEVH